MNTKSDVIVSCEFNSKVWPLELPLDPEISSNNLEALSPLKLSFKVVPNPTPQPSPIPVSPGVEASSKAAPFNIIVEISGRNKPYDPLTEYPFAPVWLDQALPLEPLITWYALWVP